MGGTTIGNWGKFEKSLFKGMSGVPDKNVNKITKGENGVLSAQFSEAKSGHLHASMVKKFFLGIITFGIYNLCHSISAKNQRATKAAACNIMVPTAEDIANGVTMIDFGNATKLNSDEQKNVIRVIAGAAGNDSNLFIKRKMFARSWQMHIAQLS